MVRVRRKVEKGLVIPEEGGGGGWESQIIREHFGVRREHRRSCANEPDVERYQSVLPRNAPCCLAP